LRTLAATSANSVSTHPPSSLHPQGVRVGAGQAFFVFSQLGCHIC
jgi:hypothetical protein